MSIKLNLPAVFTPPKTVTSSYTLTANDNMLVVNSASLVVLSFPVASSNGGKALYVKSVNTGGVNSATSNIVPLGTTAPGTTLLPTLAGKFALVVSDGTNWVTMASN